MPIQQAKSERLQTSIIKLVSMVLLSVIIGLTTLFYFGSSRIMLSMSEQVTQGIADRIIAHSDRFLGRSAQYTHLVADYLITSNTEDPEIIKNHEAIWGHLWPFLLTTPSLQSFFIADRQGSYVQVRREPKLATRYIDRSQDTDIEKWIYRDSNYNILESKTKTPKFDPRSRPWYIQTQTEKKNYWTEAYVFTTAQTPGISVTYPVINPKGDISGVVCANTPLHSISDFLKTQPVGETGKVFIVNKNGEIIAHPGKQGLIAFNSLDKKPRLLRHDELEVGWWASAYSSFLENNNRFQQFSFEETSYIAHILPFNRDYAPDWDIVLVLPETEVLGPVYNIIGLSILLAFAIGLIALVGISYVSKITARQIEQLAEEAEHIKHFELDAVKPVESRIHEVRMMNQSFMASVEALKSFARYVPSDLVKQLLQTGQSFGIGGHSTKVSILFTDIENFGQLSETMPANTLMFHMSEYFDCLTKITMQASGTVDKYMGDALMAFWGEPIPVNQPVLKTCRAALRMQDELKVLNTKWKQEGKPTFKTRMGIHYGSASVGNMGSSDRLNYTIIGDNVNVAARLEGQNKNYGTNIIISNTVHDMLEGKFECRSLGAVQVKGHKEEFEIFELISEHEDA